MSLNLVLCGIDVLWDKLYNNRRLKRVDVYDKDNMHFVKIQIDVQTFEADCFCHVEFRELSVHKFDD